MLQTDQRFPGLDSDSEDLEPNAGGSYDVFFGPEAAEGKGDDWIQAVPGKGWNVIFRLHGPPPAPWFDKTWRPGDPELVDRVAPPNRRMIGAFAARPAPLRTPEPSP